MKKIFLLFSLLFLFLISCSRGSDNPTPTPTDTQKPTAPTGLAANSITTNSFNLTWTASTDNVNVTGYNVYVNDVVIGSTSSTNYPVTGLTASTTYNVYVKAKDAAGNISDKSSTFSVTTLSNIHPSASLLMPVISVSSFRALQLNACSNENFTVSFSTSSAQRTLQSATFTLSGDGAAAYRSLRYRPAGDFTTPWKQVDFSGNSVTIPFSVIIPAGLTAKYDLKVCTKASVSGIVNGANTTLVISSITTDESGVNAPVGSSFQAAVALPALDLATTATKVTSDWNGYMDQSSLSLMPGQDWSHTSVFHVTNLQTNGNANGQWYAVTLKNPYGNAILWDNSSWEINVGMTHYTIPQANITWNGDYVNIIFPSQAIIAMSGYNQFDIWVKVKNNSATNWFLSTNTTPNLWGLQMMSKYDIDLRNSNENTINLSDVNVKFGSATLNN